MILFNRIRILLTLFFVVYLPLNFELINTTVPSSAVAPEDAKKWNMTAIMYVWLWAEVFSWGNQQLQQFKICKKFRKFSSKLKEVEPENDDAPDPDEERKTLLLNPDGAAVNADDPTAKAVQVPILKVKKDYYSMIYCMFHKHHIPGMKLNRMEQINYFNSGLLIFSAQIIFAGFIGAKFFGDVTIYSSPWYVVYIRLFATYLLHIQMLSQTTMAFSLMQYFFNHFDLFEHVWMVFLTASMQMTIAVVIEVFCILKILISATVLEVMFSYIAMSIIGKIDTIYTHALAPNDKLNKYFKNDLELEKPHPHKHGVIMDYLIHGMLYFLKVFYQVFYFYFLPFFVIVLTFAWGHPQEAASGADKG